MIRIDRHDNNIPDGRPTGNFEFLDPDLEGSHGSSYCVGLKYRGGNVRDPKNWVYDHTNYWGTPHGPGMEEEPEVVSFGKLENLLSRHGTTLERLISEYIQLEFPK